MLLCWILVLIALFVRSRRGIGNQLVLPEDWKAALLAELLILLLLDQLLDPLLLAGRI